MSDLTRTLGLRVKAEGRDGYSVINDQGDVLMPPEPNRYVAEQFIAGAAYALNDLTHALVPMIDVLRHRSVGH